MGKSSSKNPSRVKVKTGMNKKLETNNCRLSAKFHLREELCCTCLYSRPPTIHLNIVTTFLLCSFVGVLGGRSGSIKETAIIDDEIEEEEEEEVCESDNDESRDRSVSCEEFNKIMEYSERICSDLLRESTTTAVDELPPEDKEVTHDDIARYSSVSEYSNFLLSKILNEAGLNGMSKDLENTFVMSQNSRNFLEMQGIEGLSDTSSSETSSRTSGEATSGNRVSGISLASTLSAVSDGSNESDLSVTPTVMVTNSGEACYEFPSPKDENGNTDVAAVSKPYTGRNNGGLESIEEVSGTTDSDDQRYVDDLDHTSVKSNRKKPFYIGSEHEDVDQKSGKNSSIQCKWESGQ